MIEKLYKERELAVQGSKEKNISYERVTRKSLLEGPNGEREDISMAVSSEDGKLRHVNFWDLDKTLLIAEPIHAKAVNEIFPEFAKTPEAQKELHDTYFAGFTLGNSFREWDRMWRIYGEGQNQYKDASIYEHEFMGVDNPKQKLIDEPGHPEGFHERADAILQRYGKIAYEIMKGEYEKDKEGFQKSLLKPEMVQLLEAKTRLGQTSVYMTANQRDFAKGLVAFSGLNKYGFALATDETMAGGGKEIAIQKLIEEIEATGLKVDKNRASAVGDSIKGDVGSGRVAGLGSGILVTEKIKDIEKILDRSKSDTQDGKQIKDILEGTNVDAIPTTAITKSKRGIFNFGKRSRNQ